MKIQEGLYIFIITEYKQGQQKMSYPKTKICEIFIHPKFQVRQTE